MSEQLLWEVGSCTVDEDVCPSSEVSVSFEKLYTYNTIIFTGQIPVYVLDDYNRSCKLRNYFQKVTLKCTHHLIYSYISISHFLKPRPRKRTQFSNHVNP